MNLDSFRDFVCGSEDDAEDAIDDTSMFYWLDSADFDALVTAMNEFLPSPILSVVDTASPGEWAIPRFDCDGRRSTFKTMICKEDLLHGLLAINEVLGPEFTVYIAADTLGDDAVAVTVLPTKFAHDLQRDVPEQFDSRLTDVIAGQEAF
ncbi:hypothetical protein [Rubripirellula reticaptiva]|uniref:Uncharacterized protein n=1 Tax=Rubripirellula reticaptiva TaxID=2528013 RepID=A0A5C6EEG8_9BACT|nr:hypothetical protein [Rubripirellula reticaptiva]TWU46387.1 hypothetical protein Poly59_53290 [Rubripirellula reticaptiva]